MSVNSKGRLGVAEPTLTLPVATRRRRWRWKEVSGFLFVLPWLIGFLAFEFLPFIASFVISFMEWNLGKTATYVGLKNYTDLLEFEPLLVKSIFNTFYYAVFH